jgi:hypothetical protein
MIKLELGISNRGGTVDPSQNRTRARDGLCHVTGNLLLCRFLDNWNMRLEFDLYSLLVALYGI